MEEKMDKRGARPECLLSVQLTIKHLSLALVEQGIEKDVIDRAVEKVHDSLMKSLSESSHTHVETGYFYDRSQFFASERKDYFGRALIQSIEKFFPIDEETSENIKRQHIKGYLPRQTAAGLIQIMRSVLNFSTLNRYENKCLNKAAMYRRKSDRLIDVQKYVNDFEVKMIVKKVIIEFVEVYRSMGEEAASGWLLRNILHSSAFRGMGRELAEEELLLIKEHLFDLN